MIGNAQKKLTNVENKSIRFGESLLLCERMCESVYC